MMMTMMGTMTRKLWWRIIITVKWQEEVCVSIYIYKVRRWRRRRFGSQRKTEGQREQRFTTHSLTTSLNVKSFYFSPGQLEEQYQEEEEEQQQERRVSDVGHASLPCSNNIAAELLNWRLKFQRLPLVHLATLIWNIHPLCVLEVVGGRVDFRIPTFPDFSHQQHFWQCVFSQEEQVIPLLDPIRSLLLLLQLAPATTRLYIFCSLSLLLRNIHSLTFYTHIGKDPQKGFCLLLFFPVYSSCAYDFDHVI